MIHPAFEALVDYATATLSKERAVMIDQHLATCNECQTQLASIRGFLDNLRAGNQIAPRREVLHRATAAFWQIQKRATNRNQRAATLLFDSWEQSAIGVRGGVTERQLLYQWADVDIDLQIQPQTEVQSYTLYGQVLWTGTMPNQLEGAAVRLLAHENGESVRQVLVDHLGRFRISDVLAGHYLLLVELADTQVHVNELILYPSE